MAQRQQAGREDTSNYVDGSFDTTGLRDALAAEDTTSDASQEDAAHSNVASEASDAESDSDAKTYSPEQEPGKPEVADATVSSEFADTEDSELQHIKEEDTDPGQSSTSGNTSKPVATRGLAKFIQLTPILDESETESSPNSESDSPEELDWGKNNRRRKSVSTKRKQSTFSKSDEPAVRRGSNKELVAKQGKAKGKKGAGKIKVRRSSISSANGSKPKANRRQSVAVTTSKPKAKKKAKGKKGPLKSLSKHSREHLITRESSVADTEASRGEGTVSPDQNKPATVSHPVAEVEEEHHPSASAPGPAVRVGRSSSRFLQSAVLWGAGRSTASFATIHSDPEDEDDVTKDDRSVQRYEPRYGNTLEGSEVTSYLTDDDIVFVQEIKRPPTGEVGPPPVIKPKRLSVAPRVPFYKRLTIASRLWKGNTHVCRRHSRASGNYHPPVSGSGYVTPARKVGKKELNASFNVLRATVRLRQTMDDITTLSTDNIPTIENTYRTEPELEGRFSPRDVGTIMKKLLEGQLKDYTYEATNAGEMAKALTQLVLQAVKDVTSPRYKLVCHVLIGQRVGQGLLSASRSLWNTKTDSFATAEFYKKHFFCSATMHAVYFE